MISSKRTKKEEVLHGNALDTFSRVSSEIPAQPKNQWWDDLRLAFDHKMFQ